MHMGFPYGAFQPAGSDRKNALKNSDLRYLLKVRHFLRKLIALMPSRRAAAGALHGFHGTFLKSSIKSTCFMKPTGAMRALP
jgi:hypothetical protein